MKKTKTDKSKRNGVVYTPSNLANYVAQKIAKYYLKDLVLQKNKTNSFASNLGNLKIIDPACGEGELLVALWHAFKETAPMSVNINPNKMLCGTDIDNKAVKKAMQRIAALSNTGHKKQRSYFISTNALFPIKNKSVESGWQNIKNRFDAKEGFDLLIANPPWGADIKSYKNKLLNSSYSLCKGQFDTSDLFIELALLIVKPGGFFAFIIPDSLFSKERKELRKLLLSKTEIKYIGRLGEKIFKGINRACSIIICRNASAKKTDRVDCMRLPPVLRKKIISGDSTFQSADRLLSHKIYQNRFATNNNYLFDIDIKEKEEPIIKILRTPHVSFGDYFHSYRGVEVSKNGKVYKCEGCGLWFPYPNSNPAICQHCGAQIVVDEKRAKTIISKEQIKGYKPLIVGESIKRYGISSQHWISLNTDGINYKNMSIYEGPKILVRKTGVGISASIDLTKSLTNQVVYIFKPKASALKHLPLEFFLAIINSRAMYYHLLKMYGESEWRSHPYLTQQQILDMPMPNIEELNTTITNQINRTSNIINNCLKKNEALPDITDATIENIVAQMYGLSVNDYNYIFRTLDEIEQLAPVRALKNISTADIFK